MRVLTFALFLCLPVVSSAAEKPVAKPGPAPQPGFCIFGGQSGKPFGDLASFKSVVWKNDVIYAGAAADPARALQARVDVLKAMREARGSRIAVAFEALDATLQPALDEYAAGRLSEAEFLEKTGWTAAEAANFSLLRPIFSVIIQNKLRALALGLPRDTILKIQKAGLAGLNEDEKKLLPDQVRISQHKKYQEFLKASPGAVGASAPGPENYLAAASAWSESAGARIADFINANPGWAVLVAAGNDRLAYNAALPASVKSRTVKIRQASFYSIDSALCPAALPKDKKDLANYLWYVFPSTGTAAAN